MNTTTVNFSRKVSIVKRELHLPLPVSLLSLRLTYCRPSRIWKHSIHTLFISSLFIPQTRPSTKKSRYFHLKLVRSEGRPPRHSVPRRQPDQRPGRESVGPSVPTRSPLAGRRQERVTVWLEVTPAPCPHFRPSSLSSHSSLTFVKIRFVVLLQSQRGKLSSSTYFFPALL